MFNNLKKYFHKSLAWFFNNPLGRRLLSVPEGKKIYKITKSSAHYYTGEVSQQGFPIIATGECSPNGRLPLIHWLEDWKPIHLCWFYIRMGWKIPKYFIGADTGYNSPGTMGEDTTTGTVSWTNPNNAKANDGIYATVTVGPATYSYLLKATNFEFSVPAGATINGVITKTEAHDTYTKYMYGAQLVKDGSLTGTARGFDYIKTSDADYTWGNSTDLWGATLAATDVNASDFGYVHGSYGGGAWGTTTSVDWMRMTVYYTIPVVAPTVTTQAVSSIEKTTATGNGNITDDGGATATRGMCWDTSATPTITDSHATNGTGEGAYTVAMTSLVAGTKYYVRAYATNSAGTSYGSEVNFTTLAAATGNFFRMF